jgi:GTP-binding protein
MMYTREDLRNIAIIAHVDHGKTTLVDALFQQSGVYREHQEVVERVMDSNDQERERGITILAKCTSVNFGDMRLQIVDTPGHADFGGEVERTLLLVDGVVLLVDAAEGPLPQTRFVLRKSLELGLSVVVVINKVDRQDARAEEVLDEVYGLFIDLGAEEGQLDFPVLYAIARDGRAGLKPDDLADDLKPLVDTLINSFPGPQDRSKEPFLMRVNQLGYDEYVGRLIIGRVHAGTIKTNQMMVLVGKDDVQKQVRITGIYRFQGTERIALEEASSGDIVALSGLTEVRIGDSISDPLEPRSLPRIRVDAPTVAMTFQVNDGPFSGRSGGKYVTSRHLHDRLFREAYANVSIRVELGQTTDVFRVMGRGELQLAVLIEAMRRDGYEFCVRNPQVLTRDDAEGRQEPLERLTIDVPIQHIGVVSELVGQRKATLLNQQQEGSRARLDYEVPTRGLFGLRGKMLSATRGTAIMSSVFDRWTPWLGPIAQRSNGALVADRLGKMTPYALFNLQARGILFVSSSEQTYEGMVIGENSRDNDLNVNPVKEKKLNNIRTHAKDEATVLAPPRQMTIETCLEWMRDDEMMEVTPHAIRLRKNVLSANKRPHPRDR